MNVVIRPLVGPETTSKRFWEVHISNWDVTRDQGFQQGFQTWKGDCEHRIVVNLLEVVLWLYVNKYSIHFGQSIHSGWQLFLPCSDSRL